MIFRSVAIAGAMFLAVVLFFPLLAAEPENSGPARYEPVRTDDGLLAQPWFLNSFLDLREDHAEARSNGKTFAIIWELKGCPYCKVLHTTNFARPEIQTLARSKFDILQLNVLGSRKVVDFDGTELTEKQLAAKHGIRFTPTMQFYGEAADPANRAQHEIFRMAGYYQPFHFYTLLQYVSGGLHKSMKFRAFLKKQHYALKKQGQEPENW